MLVKGPRSHIGELLNDITIVKILWNQCSLKNQYKPKSLDAY
jgi:hypothetical protein